jgi:hypothetical protein
MSGEEVASRASHRNPYASREPSVTGSLGARKAASTARKNKINEEDEFDDQ